MGGDLVTYRELLQKLQGMDPARLDDVVAVDFGEDEFYGVYEMKIENEEYILEKGHLYLAIGPGFY